MRTSKTRLIAVTGATLALVLASTSIVTAHPGREDGPPFGRGLGEPFHGGLREFRDDFGFRGSLRLGDGFASDLVRRETTYEAEDGSVVTQRLDAGTVSAVSDGGLEYSLVSGETASVTIDDDTEVIGFSQETVEFGGGWSRERWVGQELELGDLAADSEVVVWAESQDDGTFLAERIMVRPDTEVTADEETTDGASDLPGTSIEEEASPAAAA